MRIFVQCILIIPTICLIIVLGVQEYGGCEINPWSGYTCSKLLVPVLVGSFVGVLTVIPTAIMVAFYGAKLAFKWTRVDNGHDGCP